MADNYTSIPADNTTALTRANLISAFNITGQNNPDGSLSAPSISFSGDQSSGLFRDSSGNVNLVYKGKTILTISSGFSMPCSASITSAGTSQSTAYVLTNQISLVTSSSSGSGVILPSAIVGATYTIINRSTNSINIYPPTGQQIETLAANTPTVLSVNSTNDVIYFGNNIWYIK